VVGIKICLRNLFVALPALGHDLKLETFRVSTTDGVSGVTAAAHGERFVCFADLSGMNAEKELLLDPVVASPARGGEILGIHARFRIGDRLLAVCRMAIRAHSGNGETALQQPFPMDALGIPLHNLVLCTCVPDRCLVPFAMASCAQARHVCRK
jgi:hypothetical protein